MKFKLLLIVLVINSTLLFSQPIGKTDGSFNAEGGVDFIISNDDNSTTYNFFPHFTMYFNDITNTDEPFDELAFLQKIGFAETIIFIFAETKQGDYSLDNSNKETTLGFDVLLHWVWDVLPITLSIPLSEKRLTWKDNTDDRYAVASIPFLGMFPGYYILPNLHISAGAGYTLPDFFFDMDNDFEYRYFASDIIFIRGTIKGVFQITKSMWLSVEIGGFQFIDDDDDSKQTVTGGNFYLTFYPLQFLGVGVRGSISKYDGESSESALIELLGVSEYTGFVKADIKGYGNIEVFGTILKPEDSVHGDVIQFGVCLELKF